MFRAAVRLSVSGVRSLTRTQPGSRALLASRCYSHGKQETDEEKGTFLEYRSVWPAGAVDSNIAPLLTLRSMHQQSCCCGLSPPPPRRLNMLSHII
uniref:Uncharacterized protein n=1 Tax=Maylandia zebra TaxID=106582 RepID=A0A3P9B8T3_9CICH